jgi:DNA-binding beta-propeller fold protein YncE
MTPTGLAFGPDGNLYVASTGTNGVLRYDGTTGEFQAAVVPGGRGGLFAPQQVAFASVPEPGALLASLLIGAVYLSAAVGARRFLAAALNGSSS